MHSLRVVVLAYQTAKCPQYQAIASNVIHNLISRSSSPKVSKMPHATFSLLVDNNNSGASSRPNGTSTLSVVKRYYASKKNAKKQSNAPVSLNLLSEFLEVETMVKGMETAIETMKTDFVKQLSLRSAGSLEAMKVKFEGKDYELQQIAKITRKGQQTIVVDMLSFPQMTKAVVDTLRSSSLNLNPQQEATTLYVPIPKVTKEHREILAKKAKVLFITCRDEIRKIQEQNIKILRSCDISDSEKQAAYKQVKTLGDKNVSQAETLMKSKQEELVGK